MLIQQIQKNTRAGCFHVGICIHEIINETMNMYYKNDIFAAIQGETIAIGITMSEAINNITKDLEPKADSIIFGHPSMYKYSIGHKVEHTGNQSIAIDPPKKKWYQRLTALDK